MDLDQNIGPVNGFLHHDYVLTGKISGVFMEEASTTFCFIAIEQGSCEESKRNKYQSRYHITRNSGLGKFAQNAMLAGVPVRLYCKYPDRESWECEAVAIEISFGVNTWRTEP